MTDEERIAQENERIAAVTDLVKQIEELTETLEGMTRQHCYTNRFSIFKDSPQTNVTDSGGLSADAEALRLLDKLKRFRIEREHGKMVVGYWPENDPKKDEKTEKEPEKADGLQNHD